MKTAEMLATECFDPSHGSEGASYPSVLAAIEKALEIRASIDRDTIGALTRQVLSYQEQIETSAPPPDTAGVIWQIEHDGFKGREIGSYTTLEGKQGVVLQQIGTQVVHVYNRKWLKPCPAEVTDRELVEWAREWHWADCAEDKPIDLTIYPRDLRMLKAFVARVRPAAGVTGEPVAWRYRFVTSVHGDLSDWFIVDDPKSIPNRECQTVQALYAHPTPLDRQAVERETIERCAKWHEHEADLATNGLHCGDNATTIGAAHRRAGWHLNAAKSLRALPPLPGTEGDSSVARSSGGGEA